MISLHHTADWQIGRTFSQFEPDDAAALFEARFKVVERLAAVASERYVDAGPVAGDVFDAQTIADKTIRRLFNAMQGFVGTWWLMPGNHDAALSESFWSRSHRLGGTSNNVAVCLEHNPYTKASKLTLENDVFPSAYDKTDEQLEEAARLVYVGVTRAKTQIHLTHDADESPLITSIREAS